MYLSNKQWGILIIPFFIAFLFYFVSDDLAQRVKSFFPAYEEYTNKVLDKKIAIYLDIEKNDAKYKHIMKALKDRKENAMWMVKDVLYGEYNEQKVQKVERKIYKKRKRHIVYKWRVQAIFPTKNVAIVNGKMVRLGGIIDHGKVIDIQKDKILIQYKKGKKWVYMFR